MVVHKAANLVKICCKIYSNERHSGLLKLKTVTKQIKKLI